MPSILQYAQLTVAEVVEALFLAGTQLSGQSDTGFKISGNGYTLDVAGQAMTYRDNGTIEHGMMSSFTLYEGDPADGKRLLAIFTDQFALIPDLLNLAFAHFDAGRIGQAKNVVRNAWATESWSITDLTSGAINGTMGDDTIFGGPDGAVIDGRGGNDFIVGGAGDDLVYGGNGHDTIKGNNGNDTLYGRGGNDLLDGGDGDDQLFGQSGNDTLYGQKGNDLLNGAAGNDYLDGGAGNDSLNGGLGNDTLAGGSGEDRIHGGAGDDIIFGGNDNDTAWGGDGNDRIEGGNGDDVLKGQNGDDLLYGQSGNDRLFGEAGNDLLNGAAGDDALFGGAGDDSLNGGDGADALYGGGGTNVLTGGGGADLFVFKSGDGAFADTITDFADGVDRIRLESFGFASVDAALAVAVDTKNGVLFTFAEDQTLLVRKTTIADLADDLRIAGPIGGPELVH